MRSVPILTVLGSLWLLLSGHFTPLLLVLGLASVLLVVWPVKLCLVAHRSAWLAQVFSASVQVL